MDDIQKDIKDIINGCERTDGDLYNIVNDFCYNRLRDVFIKSLEQDVKVIMFNVLVEILINTNETKERLNIVDQLIELANEIKASGRTTKVESDKILCFYGFLHVLYKHELYPDIISQDRVDRKVREVGKMDYQDTFYSIASKSVEEIAYQYKNTFMEIKQIYGK